MTTEDAAKGCHCAALLVLQQRLEQRLVDMQNVLHVDEDAVERVLVQDGLLAGVDNGLFDGLHDFVDNLFQQIDVGLLGGNEFVDGF